jgi:predicted nucleotidyltransferase
MPTAEFPRLNLPAPYLYTVRAILRSHLPEAEIWAYGSRVNGDYYEASDLDLVARQPEDLKQRQIHLCEAIEAFSESDLPIFVQLVDWAAIPEAFHAEIEANYVVIQSENPQAQG